MCSVMSLYPATPIHTGLLSIKYLSATSLPIIVDVSASVIVRRRLAYKLFTVPNRELVTNHKPKRSGDALDALDV